MTTLTVIEFAFLVWTTTGQAASADNERSSPREPRVYRAWLDSPGGELPFQLEISEATGGSPRAWVLNGQERIEVAQVSRDDELLTLSFPHYDSRIEATPRSRGPDAAGDSWSAMDGTWTKSARAGGTITMPFHCEAGGGARFKPMTSQGPTGPRPEPVAGRWSVRSGDAGDPAVGIFREMRDGSVEGTFLTETGDYRFLSGSYEGGLLRLSCFDGSHAFLFHATMQSDGAMKGDFWSGTSWHETWTARRDEQAHLADGFKLTSWNDRADFASMKFRDLEGAETSLASAVAGGRGVVIEVFGSWCPNCHDASSFLAEMDRRYRDKGLRIVGLAFEYTGQVDRDAKQVRRFAERYHVEYPLFLAGKADKAEASKALPMLDAIRAFPTLVFMRADGTIRGVYSGFTGPAAADEHAKLRKELESMIEDVIAPGKTSP